MSQQAPRKSKFFPRLFGLLGDLLLVGIGALVYYHFMVQPLAPIGMNPQFSALVGGETNAVYIISGLLVAGGVYGLLTLILRIVKETVRK